MRLEQAIEPLVRRHPTRVIGGFALLALLAIPPASQIRIDPSFEAIYVRGDPLLEHNLAMKAAFSSDEATVVAIDFGRPFGADELRLVNRLSRQIAAVEGVEEVLDLTTIEDVRSTNGDLDGSPLVDLDTLSEELPRIRARIAEHPLYRRNLVSEDGQVLVLVAVPEYRPEQPTLATELVAEVRGLLPEVRRACGCDVYLSGYAVTVWDANRLIQRDLLLLGGLALVIVMAMNALLYRRLFAALLTLVVVLWAQLASLAFLGGTGRAITIPTGLVTPMVTAVSSTYAVYVLGLLKLTSSEPSPGAAVVAHVVRPALLSSLTTAAGFLSLNLMPVRSVADLGNALSVALIASASASMLLAPALIERFGWRLGDLPYPGLQHLAQLGVRLTRHPWLTLGGAAAVVAVAGAGISRVAIETDPLAYWEEDSEFRVSHEFTVGRVGGTETINVVIETDREGGALEPAVLAYADAVVDRLETSPMIDRTISLLDYLALIDVALEPGRPGRPVPPSREIAAQYLLLYEAGGDPEDLRHYVDFDRSALNLMARLNDTHSRRVLTLRDEIEAFAVDRAPDGVSAQVIGSQVLANKAHESVARGMVRGLAGAIVAIFAVLVVALRSMRLAGMAMVPNLLPIVVCGGVAGWTGASLSISTSMVGCIALGLAVDDTVHVLGHVDPRRSLGEVFARVGRPLIVTTLSVGVGFLTIGLSEFEPVRVAGIATALTLVVALLADILVLPSLLELVRWRRLFRAEAAQP